MFKAKDEQLGNLQLEKVDLTLKARGAEDALCYKEKVNLYLKKRYIYI